MKNSKNTFTTNESAYDLTIIAVRVVVNSDLFTSKEKYNLLKSLFNEK